MSPKTQVWMKGMMAAAISGCWGGVMSGLAAVGIDPQHFNLGAGMGHTAKITLAAMGSSSIIGVAAYLKQSPLPPNGQ